MRTPMTSWPPKAPPPNVVTLGAGISTYEFWGRHKHSTCSIPTNYWVKIWARKLGFQRPGSESGTQIQGWPYWLTPEVPLSPLTLLLHLHCNPDTFICFPCAFCDFSWAKLFGLFINKDTHWFKRSSMKHWTIMMPASLFHDSVLQSHLYSKHCWLSNSLH